MLCGGERLIKLDCFRGNLMFERVKMRWFVIEHELIVHSIESISSTESSRTYYACIVLILYVVCDIKYYNRSCWWAQLVIAGPQAELACGDLYGLNLRV